MNLYNSTIKGVLAAREARHRRLLHQMAAAAVGKAERLGVGAVNSGDRNLEPASQKLPDSITRNPTDVHSQN